MYTLSDSIQNLRCISLNLKNCRNIKDDWVPVVADMLTNGSTTLEELTLNFDGVRLYEDSIMSLASELKGDFPAIYSMVLSFNHCNDGMENVNALCQKLCKKVSMIKYLTIRFSNGEDDFDNGDELIFKNISRRLRFLRRLIFNSIGDKRVL